MASTVVSKTISLGSSPNTPAITSLRNADIAQRQCNRLVSDRFPVQIEVSAPLRQHRELAILVKIHDKTWMVYE